MDDLIVIILTLIIAVVGALGQIKKKKQGQPQNQQTDQEQEPSGFWDIFEKEQEYTVDQQEEMPHQEVEVQPVTINEKVERTIPQYEFTPENEGKSIYGDDLTMKHEQKNKHTKRKIKDFSLKKAVIYSEILNRKYN